MEMAFGFYRNACIKTIQKQSKPRKSEMSLVLQSRAAPRERGGGGGGADFDCREPIFYIGEVWGGVILIVGGSDSWGHK